MNSPLDIAVANNRIWCEIVSESHRIAHTASDHVWTLLSKAPPFYPDIITINKKVKVEEVHELIGNREMTSVKDSYANLDLTPCGFKILLEAEWIYHAPMRGVEPAPTSWYSITTEQDLFKWSLANGTEAVIQPDLLQRNDVKIFMHNDNDELSGFIANLGANAIGISNVFSTGNAKKSIWTDIVHIASAQFPGLPLVGYEQDTSLTSALISGWTSLGPLRVWIYK